jgi:hypothetical protein
VAGSIGVTLVTPALETFEKVADTVPSTIDTYEPAGVTATFVIADVAEQPFPSKAETQYWPDRDTMIDRVPSPVDQRFELAALDVKVTAPSGLGDCVIVGTGGSGLTVTVLDAEPVHEYWPSTETV